MRFDLFGLLYQPLLTLTQQINSHFPWAFLPPPSLRRPIIFSTVPEDVEGSLRQASQKPKERFVVFIKGAVMANSRLKHYNGKDVLFSYLDHRTKNWCLCLYRQAYSAFAWKRFRLIRYFGFLANRNRARLLPIVHRLFNSHYPDKPETHSWQFLVERKTGIDPLCCILCKNQLRLANINVGLSSFEFGQYHAKPAKNKAIRVFAG